MAILEMSVEAREIRAISESYLSKIWQHQLLDKTELRTEDGELVAIIYPGRINDDHGADFRDAVITTSRGLIKGDVELHIKSSGWREHRHHQDVAYNRVILHVVMWHNAKTVTKLQNGQDVPILALNKYLNNPLSQKLNSASSRTILQMPCLQIGRRPTTNTITRLLESAGKARFLAKAARFQTDLTQIRASQSLYQGIMGALGYSKNKLPMLKLAHILPLHLLESMTGSEKSDEECLIYQQSLLLGTAGLLLSQCPERYQRGQLADRWLDKLESIWASFQGTEVMSYHDWHLFKVRPNNSPLRRLVAMSYLLLRYRQEGILDAVVNLVKEAPANHGHRHLGEGLAVTTDDYWANHFDFSSGRRESPTLLGSGRVADITVNVLLPFTFAWGQFIYQTDLAGKAIDLYRSYPRLPTNSVEKHMTEQLSLSSSLVNSAQRQQGLIHIYNNWCTQGRCDCCRLAG
ncbi:MAG: DUF2851 family protein [Chloroflexi bacterium]|nr:DUF2851 family protein [Chloroflexota bacterium]